MSLRWDVMGIAWITSAHILPLRSAAPLSVPAKEILPVFDPSRAFVRLSPAASTERTSLNPVAISAFLLPGNYCGLVRFSSKHGAIKALTDVWRTKKMFSCNNNGVCSAQ